MRARWIARRNLACSLSSDHLPVIPSLSLIECHRTEAKNSRRVSARTNTGNTRIHGLPPREGSLSRMKNMYWLSMYFLRWDFPRIAWFPMGDWKRMDRFAAQRFGRKNAGFSKFLNTLTAEGNIFPSDWIANCRGVAYKPPRFSECAFDWVAHEPCLM